MIFTATDGTKFEDRNAWRRYEFETNYTFRNKQGETLMKLPGKIGGQPFDLSDLDNCEVLLLDQSDQVQVDNLSNCRVFIGPSSESVFVRNCTNCIFTVACKQLRTRDCSSCSFYLYSLTDPIIETSTDMQFAPFNGAYNGLEQHFRDARLEPDNNHWSQVYDFNDPDKTGANWRILKTEEEHAPWVVDLESHVPGASQTLGVCANPVARDTGFIKYTESSSSSGMQSFTFKTTQKDAEKTVTSTPAPAVVAPSIPIACEKQEPARSLPPPPAAPVSLAPPAPPSVAAVVPPPAPSATQAPPMPPAPTPLPTMENQKVALIESVEHPTPPPSLPQPELSLTTTDCAKPTEAAKAAEPAGDAATAQVTEMIALM